MPLHVFTGQQQANGGGGGLGYVGWRDPALGAIFAPLGAPVEGWYSVTPDPTDPNNFLRLPVAARFRELVVSAPSINTFDAPLSVGINVGGVLEPVSATVPASTTGNFFADIASVVHPAGSGFRFFISSAASAGAFAFSAGVRIE